MTIGRAVAVLLALAVLVSGCATAGGSAEPPWPAPASDRPVVRLAVDMAADLATATGTESVVFTPDQPVCELVFRLWANKPTTAASGTSSRITGAAVGGVSVTPRVEQAGAPTGAPGTLVELPLPACVAAGTPVTADLTFTLTLGRDAGERVGYSSTAGTAWLATAFPLLAWVRGSGWARDPAVDQFGESVTSEDFRLDELTVTAADGQEVLGTGTASGTSTPSPGRVAHRFTADAVRDVAVSVGRFDVVTRQVGNVRLHVGATSGSRASAGEWADELTSKIETLGELLGPYPYPDLWATIVPPQSDGVEFPTALQFGDERRSQIAPLVAHELAHQWFYALVGNNQAAHPWLDESFATYVQAVTAGQQDEYEQSDVPRRLVGELGQPMSFWAQEGDFDRYVRGVYDQGAAALLEGRRTVGAERFDAALRGYLRVNAHRVATPADVETAFRDVPEVLDLLRDAGAFS
jgi:Peptidase family M1 domain